VSAEGPIFVTADEPLLIFQSAEGAVEYLEWQDVDDGLYRGYDREGRLIEFGTKDRIVVYKAEAQPTHHGELRHTLARILSSWTDVDKSEIEAAPLRRLQDLAVERFGITY
jgi:hypothetical protein